MTKESPTLDEDGWELESAVERNRQYPNFEIPNREEREAIRIGQMVKLLFLFRCEEHGEEIIECERMWVTVISANNGKYKGELESHPATSEVLSPGACVEFDAEHICSVFIPKTDPMHPENMA
jgi:uncharacterized protein YegJ (DUF2314 family)